jgi:type IV pilus assembly protein PilQ
VVTGLGGTVAFFDEDTIFATLEALQTDGKSRVTSMPRVLVNDNEQGSITNQREEPTTRTTIPVGSDTPIIEFKDYVSAGTKLQITPHISEGDYLKLEIQLDVDSFDGRGSANVPPPKSVNNVNTIVNVPDGKYIVLGGLTTRTESTTVNKVPLLGDIPLVGLLFRNVSKADNEAVLYVFVKADIVQDENFADLDNLSEIYRQRLRENEREYHREQDLIPGVELPEEPQTRWPILEN